MRNRDRDRQTATKRQSETHRERLDLRALYRHAEKASMATNADASTLMERPRVWTDADAVFRSDMLRDCITDGAASVRPVING